ncbi:ubiquitin-conjugating enzyme E2 [Humisphaera borealis]|uniref:UBC core domain-containing protein n=1 Tax=Humisphaera borealis TaxID=2807512 RepID=A0A7M2WVE4_9BACT|nr:ubiquitin-conjugating enzyme E2 [Humisphaera borealis]QOV88811.1 hypothetical protein IPV69_21690 [Humisphaera borealis]
MIHFNCPQCSRAFTVRDQDAGRRAKCRTCGSDVVVPQTDFEPAPKEGDALAPAAVAPVVAGGSATTAKPTEAAVASEPRRIPMRIRRLTADAEQMASAFANSPHIRVISTEGSPPELYRLAYKVNSLDRGKKPNQPVPRQLHEVEIQLTSEYPRISPKCRMLTPIFHPNIDPTTICVGDHWAAGERLVDLAVRIGEMLAFQAYNIKSPLDAEAAMWADLNADKLPTDTSDLRPAE